MTSIIEGFDINRFGRAIAKFDPAELEKINGQLIQDMPFDMVKDQLAASMLVGERCSGKPCAVISLLLARQKYGGTYAPVRLCRLLTSNEVTDAAAVLLPAGPIDASIWKAWTTAIAAETGIKGKGLFMPLRLALTGRDSGPELAPLA